MDGITRSERFVVEAGFVVSAIASASLGAALLSLWSLPVYLSAAALSVSAVVVHRRRTECRPMSSFDWLTLLLVVGSLVLVLPGNRVSVAGLDPGVYVQATRHLAETGGMDFANPVDRYGLGETVANADFAAVDPWSVDPSRLRFAFFHVYPALAAGPYALGQTLAITLVSPLLGALGVAAVAGILRRLSGPTPALLGAAFLGSSYVWVFFSDWNGSEIPTASLTLAATLCTLVAWDLRRAEILLVAGLAAGIAAAGRVDGVVIFAGATAIAALLASRWSFAAALRILIGLVPGVGLWAAQAYWSGVDYAEVHNAPSPIALTVGLSAVFVLFLVGGSATRSIDNEQLALAVNRFAVVGVSGLLAALTVRAINADIPAGERFNEFWRLVAIERFQWFLTPPATVLALLGLAELARRRELRTLAALGLGLAAAPIFFWDPRIAANLIWAMRRFIPLVWPATAILVGLGGALVLERLGNRRRWVAIVLFGLVLGPQLRWTVPLRDHREWSGAFNVPVEIAAAGTDDAVFLWIRGESSQAFAVPLSIETSGQVVGLPNDVTIAQLDAIQTALETETVVIADDRETLEALGLQPNDSFVVEVPHLAYRWSEIPTEASTWRFPIAIAAGGS